MNPPGPWTGLQVIARPVAATDALVLETVLIQSALAEGRTIYNIAPRSISAADAQGLAVSGTVSPISSWINPKIYGGR